MRAVVDTNVVAYLLLNTERFADEARRCMAVITAPMAPSHWEAELANVIWQAVRAGVLLPEDGPARLGLASSLGIETVATTPLCQGALARSIASGVAVYDTLFVELAVRLKCPLVTFDKAVLRAFPDVAVRPGWLAEKF